MLSTLFPPDPTLTVDNVSHIMEKVEPNKRQEILKKMIVLKDIFDVIRSSEKYSTALEVEAAVVDIYVNCHPYSSWSDIASRLYEHHQMAAVKEVRSYLSPRGKLCCGVHASMQQILCRDVLEP